MDADVRTLIDSLRLEPHPEGGWFRETWRDPDGAGTAIYFLLGPGDRSRWHRVLNATEVWHHYAGGPLRLSVSPDGDTVDHFVLGADVGAGQRPQLTVPCAAWQSAEPLGGWALAGCTVSPAFDFSSFVLAPTGWSPTQEGAAGARG